jgi:2-polyprenyl-3-methyl-5-hydroxy-6-metoxy-1,4-benzoquinol methylase
MLFANPVEPELVEGGFYDRLATSYYLSPDKLESDYAPVRFVRELRLFRRFCRSGQVLDVGCSTGAFLHQLARRFPGDYQALGTDVCGPALDYAESRGVPVLRTPFLEHDFAGRQFDAVTFWAVLEHLAEPRKFLVKAASVLKPGGYCFALVPNIHSLAARCLGTRYRYITKEHLNYFTAETMQRLVAQEPALRVVALTSTHFNPVVLWQDWRGGGQPVTEAERARLLKSTTRWKASPRLAPLGWIYAGVEWLLAGLRLGDNLAMVLRRR